jgi:hypothetical protein
MKLARWLIGISCAVGIVSADSKVFSQPANQVAQHPESQWSTIQLYCFGCHNEGIGAGNLFLDQLGAESVPEHPEIFEKSCAQIARAPDAAARHAPALAAGSRRAG